MRHGSRPELRIAGASTGDERPVLITGGAGFVGTNLAHRLLSAGTPVCVYDDLSRPGVEHNLRWLLDSHGPLLRAEIADVRDANALQRSVRSARQVVHLAAQVAVTTSLSDPIHDFEVNARGTLNLLAALNDLAEPPPLLFTSTNKVYGGLEDIRLENSGGRYRPAAEPVRSAGIDETRTLDFHSPYGCSKGAADQYVLDYARTWARPAVVFRMSCIYGPHQCGNEDQGWVAHFLLRALQGEPITLYGDGQQVRDVLFVEDLVDAMLLAFSSMDTVSGRAFNIGGGPGNTTSLLELLDLIGEIRGEQPDIRFDEWRPADQRYYVSDVARFAAATGWRPRTSVAAGVQRLHDWLVTRAVPAAATSPWHVPGAPAAAVVGE